MSAALSAASSGHTVTLFEKRMELGGLIRRTLTPAWQADTAAYIGYLDRAVRGQNNIRLYLGVTATPEKLGRAVPSSGNCGHGLPALRG